MNALPPSSVLQRNERLAWRVLEGEVVVLYPEEGTLHRLNGTGTRLWELLDGQRSLSDIGTAMVDEYQVSFADAVRDIQSIAADLVHAGLALEVA